MAEATKPRRRWLQYSLRTLLLFVLLVSLGMSWFTVKLRQAERQRQAAETLRGLGAFVIYDYQYDASGRFVLDAEPPGPAWLRAWLGDDYFDNVSRIDVFQGTVVDDSLKPLADLPRVRWITLMVPWGTQVTDDGLSHIENLTELESLCLSRSRVVTLAALKNLHRLEDVNLEATRVTDAGLANLQELKQLKRLDLSCNNITDAGLRYLQELTNLEILNLSDPTPSGSVRSRITDAGLKHLSGLTRLRCLSIDGAMITDEGLAYLEPLTQLEYLSLTRTPVANLADFRRATQLEDLELDDTGATDAALERLRGLPRLREVALRNTRVTDAGLAHLAECPALKQLFLDDTVITGDGLVHLQGLPRLRLLSLSRTAMSDSTMAHLSKMRALESLQLDGTEISDQGLKHISQLDRLTDVSLSGTPIGDTAIEHLAQLASLKTLNLQGTRVTKAGVAKLQQRLPNCAVYCH